MEDNFTLEENNDEEYVEIEQEIEHLSEEEDNLVTPSELVNTDVQEILVVDNITSDRVTFLEYTEITGVRAEAISRFNNCMVDISGLTDPIKMAEREFSMRKCPLIIQREVGTNVTYTNSGQKKIQKVVCYLDPNTAIHPARSHVDELF